jgi:sugar/nucleoside kinase (ribokinase family)
VAPDLVVLGNLLVDDVVLPDGRTRMGQPGGAALYFALGATLWGGKPGVVTWAGDDYPRDALEAAAARGADLAGVRALGKPGLRTWLLYEGRVRRVVHRLLGPAHADVSPTSDLLPPSWRAARAFHVAPQPLQVQEELIRALSPVEGALLSLDPYVPVRPDTLAAWRHLAARVDVFFLSEDDLDVPGALDEPRPVLEALASGRLRFLLFKRGERGGLALDARERRWTEWPARAERVVDATGAGDAFAAGVLAGLLKGEALAGALVRGAVGASFALEEWGPAGLLAATAERAEARLRAWSPG